MTPLAESRREAPLVATALAISPTRVSGLAYSLNRSETK